jgi:hypothetical protein
VLVVLIRDAEFLARYCSAMPALEEARMFLWPRPSGLRFVDTATWSRSERKRSPLEGVSYRIPRRTWLGI